MTPAEINEYVKYRLETAYKTFNAAKVLAENGYWNSAVNRLYYAVFYAVSALLAVNNIHPKSHATVKSQFSLHFIKTQKLDLKYGKLLNELHNWRQKADYENIFDYDEESVTPLFEPVSDMIKQIELEIRKTI